MLSFNRSDSVAEKTGAARAVGTAVSVKESRRLVASVTCR